MGIKATVDVQIPGLQNLQKQSSRMEGPFEKMKKRWAVRYRTYIRDRFSRFSRGGGDWPKLKRKRKKGALSAASILRDTGTLFTVVATAFSGAPGALEQVLPDGIRVGFGGTQKHPSGQGVSIRDLAEFHHLGAGVLPVRIIIVIPDATTLSGMRGDTEMAIQEANASG